MDNMIVRVVDLRSSVPAFTVVDENSDFNIYLNARVSYEARRKALTHEVLHINNGHFFNDKDVALDEAEARAAAQLKV